MFFQKNKIKENNSTSRHAVFYLEKPEIFFSWNVKEGRHRKD
jgi:hypothetical protein